MASTDNELLRDYTRVRTESDTSVIEAAVINWEGAHTPKLSWVEATRLPENASAEEVDQARGKLLQSRKFFVVCQECTRRRLWGHTNGSICHSCMERNHGVVF